MPSKIKKLYSKVKKAFTLPKKHKIVVKGQKANLKAHSTTELNCKGAKERFKKGFKIISCFKK